MHVIYFFIVLSIINIAMFLLLTQCLEYYKTKANHIRGIIIVSSCLIFTIISALIYSGMVGWKSKENYDWNLSQGFKVSSQRQKCMNEQVCRDSKHTNNSHNVLTGKCTAPTQTNLTTENFPPTLSQGCVVNPDCEGEYYGSGCHKWTNGWNGNKNFPMTYSNWINNPDTSTPINWPRTDATSNMIGYIPPTSSCINNKNRPNPPHTNYAMSWDSYSTLGQYNNQLPWKWQLPTPGFAGAVSYREKEPTIILNIAR